MFHKPLIGVCLALSLIACATTPSAPTAKSLAADSTAPPGCVGTTATRLPVTPGDCAGFGHTYTHDDLSRTGGQTVGQALRNLDPTLTVGGQ
jgi:hypothetical protein